VPLIPACIITLLVGVVIGAINGFFIVNLGINAFIITLGSMTILSGLTFGITGGNVIVNLPPALLTFGRQELFGLPLAIYYGWTLALVLAYVYERTPIGRYLLFVGGNRDAARLAGLPVTQIRFLAFVFSSLISAFAGIVLASKLGAIDPTIGPSYLLPPYAAAFLGTTAVQIGRFNVGGTVIAIYMLIIGITGLLLMGSDPWVSDAFDGGALIVAVTFAGLAGRKAAD
jgi:ribose transport system permease protein